ncbi:2-hydroxyacid dehydrogenase [Brevibacterium yomogidense]|uniref:2-hydroxyacid dehydrogenase n=1 Tax=Brevibacterium yomogidense TaxID=946573 RepID=UPI0018E0562F|nr:2-hydroxyacid dehydrogenase [Brevibacterium yomogidense]
MSEEARTGTAGAQTPPSGLVKTVAFPTQELRSKVDARIVDHQQSRLDFVVWSAEEQSRGLNKSAIEAVVLPYPDHGPTIDRLHELPNLKFVQLQTTGYDAVIGKVGPEVQVATASGVHAAATAELAVALTLARLRGVDDAARDMTEHNWNHRQRPSLADRKVLIVGAGGIGNAIFDRFAPFEVEQTRVATTARDDDRGHIHGIDELPQLLPTAEVVVLITPLTDRTEKLVNKEFLAALPDKALIVNVARGGVVDTDALVAELESGRLQAALDVTDPEPLPKEHPLWSTPNTLLTPHVGGNASAFHPRIENLLVEQVYRLQIGKELLNLVDVSED